MSGFIQGPVGRLETIEWSAQDEAGRPVPARAAALVAHPHPLHGGTMDSNVVFRIARGLQRAGLDVLRFNFRGAGASEGEHDGRGAEEEDARAALEHLERTRPGLELWAAGFSFGARTVAALAVREPRIARLAAVALPVLAFDCSPVRGLRRPAFFLMAGEDDFGSAAAVRELFGELPANVELDEIPGVDHFFRGATPELEARVRAWARRSLERKP